MNRSFRFNRWIFGWVAVALLVACAPQAPSSMAPASTQQEPSGATQPASAAQAKNGAQPDGGLKKLRVTQSVAESVAFMPIFVARYFNFFGDEGLAADIITTAGGGPDVAALIAGEAQFTAAGPINQLALLQEGQRTLSFASFGDRLTVNLVMNKDAYQRKGLSESSSDEEKLAALRGSKIAVTRRGALTDMVARMYAVRAGLDPDSDITIVATGAGQPQIAALEQGQVDLVAATTPTAETLVERGVGEMLFYNSGGEDPSLQPFTGYSIIVREDYPSREAETVKAFARAIVKANQWVVEHSAEEAAKVMNFYVPNLEPGVLATHFGYIKGGVPADGCLTEKGVTANIELFRAAGLLKQEIQWTDIATNEYLPTPC